MIIWENIMNIFTLINSTTLTNSLNNTKIKQDEIDNLNSLITIK